MLPSPYLLSNELDSDNELQKSNKQYWWSCDHWQSSCSREHHMYQYVAIEALVKPIDHGIRVLLLVDDEKKFLQDQRLQRQSGRTSDNQTTGLSRCTVNIWFLKSNWELAMRWNDHDQFDESKYTDISVKCKRDQRKSVPIECLIIKVFSFVCRFLTRSAPHLGIMSSISWSTKAQSPVCPQCSSFSTQSSIGMSWSPMALTAASRQHAPKKSSASSRFQPLQ